jgi:phosphoribosyl 1,2-cyclic phosphate phosphodiesterase
LPVYCEDFVEARIRKSFDYAFAEDNHGYAGGVPQITFNRITTEPFSLLGKRIIPIRLMHGKFRVLGFRIGNIAYCTDVSRIPKESFELLKDLDLLVLDALQHRPHTTHFSLGEAVEAAHQIGAKQTLFTHIAHAMPHEETNKLLSPNMALGYDGQRVLSPLPAGEG